MSHKTRDHRFAYISTGDITSWAKRTNRPNIKQGLGVKSKRRPRVSSLDSIRASNEKHLSVKAIPTSPMSIQRPSANPI